MKISNGIEIKDLCLVIGKTLVIPDVHIGYEEAMNKQGILLPREQFDKTMKRLEKILDGLKLDTIVLLGDIKHEFGVISETEWRQTLHLLDFLGEYCKKLVLIKGNHDTNLGPIAKKRNLDIEDYYVVGDVYLCHGHEVPEDMDFALAKKVVIGHEHAAIGLTKGLRVEKFKCFIKGKFCKKELIVMPSFNLVTEGTDLLRDETLSPFLKQDLDEFRVYVVGDDEVLDFGKIKDVKNLDE
jgi:hypothetical protein